MSDDSGIRYRLRIGPQEIALQPGETTVGRADSCTLCLDDERLSRLHAKFLVDGPQVAVIDMGSRNGTYLNDLQIKGRIYLQQGDKVRMGQTEMTLVIQRIRRKSSGQRATLLGTETLGGQSIGAGIDLLSKVLQMNRLDEAEKLLKARVGYLLQANPKPAADEPMARSAVDGIVILAEKTMDQRWLDRLFKLHTSCGWFMAEGVQRKVEQLLRAFGKLEGDGLVTYVTTWQGEGAKLGSSDRERLARLNDLLARS